MSNQIVITSGAKVRNLDGVLTGTAGIVGSVGFGTANGVATLDSTGKVPLSQLPASIITYLGTWNALTNTPTLVNGVGDVGDLYICNVAGTANFGAGPIIFAVGDWVIYNGSEWQKSAGTNGTVTSVAMTVPTGLSVSGSPITTAGTLDVSLASGYTIPTTSFLQGLVPYTGATQSVDLGAYDLNARGIKINGTGGLGHADFKHQSGTPTGSASSSTLYADTNGDIAWLNDHSHTITLAANANTADRTYTFPNASGTLALTTDISYPVTSVFGRTGAVTAQSGDYTTTQVTEGTNLYFTDARARAAISLTTSGSSGAATYNSTTGVLNVPNYGSALSGYVPYTGATAQVDLGSNNLYGKSLNVWGDGTNGGGLNLKQYTSQSFLPGYGYTAVFTDSSYGFGIWFLNGASTGRQINFNASLLANNTGQTYYLPAATGTIALTSDIPSLTNYVTTNTNQTITGIKTFTNEQLFGNGMTLTGGYITYTSGSFNLTLNTNLLTANRNVYIKDGSGTLAFTSDIPSLSGYVQGSGTTNYISKFTGSGTIGNSLIYDNGTSVGVNTTSLTLKFNVAGDTYSSQGFFVQDSTNTFIGSLNNTSGMVVNGTTLATVIRSGGNNVLTLASSGAATFSSSVTANGDVTINGNRTIYLTNPSTAAGSLVFYNSTSSSIKAGVASYYNVADEGDLEFLAGGASTKMIIRSSGNVGIGTTSPSFAYGGGLEVANSLRATLSLTQGLSTLGIFQQDGNAYINNIASGDLIFRMTTGNTERMRITSGGNVGIGTTNPLDNLVVSNAGANTLHFDVTYSGGASTIYSYNRSTSVYTNLQFQGDNLIFKTGASERMRITSGGKVLVGTSSVISGNYAVQASAFGGFVTNASNSGDASYYSVTGTVGWHFYAEGGGSTRMYVLQNGDVRNANNSYGAISDISLKENITDATPKLQDLLKVKVRNYNFIADETKTKQIGVIAQELEEVFPNMISEDKQMGSEETIKTVKYSVFVPMLIKAIQELSAKVTALENKI